MTRARLLSIIGIAAIATAFAASASTPERAIKYRQNVFGLIGWNFAAMGELVRERRPWDAAEFARRAERVAQLSKMTDEGFPEGSATGAMTEAKAAIWTNRADFDAKLQSFIRKADALASIAQGGDAAAMKAQFAKTGGTCKACHDEYKAD